MDKNEHWFKYKNPNAWQVYYKHRPFIIEMIESALMNESSELTPKQIEWIFAKFEDIKSKMGHKFGPAVPDNDPWLAVLCMSLNAYQKIRVGYPNPEKIKTDTIEEIGKLVPSLFPVPPVICSLDDVPMFTERDLRDFKYLHGYRPSEDVKPDNLETCDEFHGNCRICCGKSVYDTMNCYCMRPLEQTPPGFDMRAAMQEYEYCWNERL